MPFSYFATAQYDIPPPSRLRRPATGDDATGRHDQREGGCPIAIYQTYTVARNDTLGHIAERFDTAIEALVALNGLADADSIAVGQVLRILRVSEAYYTVVSGDTLSSVAQRHGVTTGQLVKANALADANRIRVGSRLIIPTATPTETASSISPVRELGNLSRKYEVSNNGPGTVSGGHGDRGGVSYGSYQLASKLGNPQRFLDKEGQRWLAEFAGTTQGSDAFTAVWKTVAAREPDLFHAAQHDYIKRTHFDPQVRKIKSLSGIDVTLRSHALMDVVWSAAVQHGANSTLIGKCLEALALAPTDPGYDAAAIKAIYGERGRTDADGKLVHFRRNSIAVQQGVARRFRNELNDALDMLEAEQALHAVTPPPDATAQQSRSLLEKAQRSLTDEEVHLLVERYGDIEAKGNFLNGRKVVIALRIPTDGKQYLRGRFDDPMLVVWRNGDGSVGLKRFMGNTEPARIYAWGQSRQDRGSSIDLDSDGRNDLGRLRAGTYHYFPRSDFLGNKAFRARDIQVAMRDVNHDGKFSLVGGDMLDEVGAGRSMLFHQGGRGDNTWSAGCQTISSRYYNSFLSTLGNQDGFSYILVNVE